MLYITDAYHHYDYIFFLLFFVPFLYLISVKLNQKNEQKIYIYCVYNRINNNWNIVSSSPFHFYSHCCNSFTSKFLLFQFVSFFICWFFWARTRFLEFQFSLRGNLWFFEGWLWRFLKVLLAFWRFGYKIEFLVTILIDSTEVFLKLIIQKILVFSHLRD